VQVANPVTANAETQKNTFDFLLARDIAFRQFALLDGNGQQMAQDSRLTRTLSAQFLTQLKGDAVTLTAKGQNFISPIYIDNVSSEPLIAIAIPVKNIFGDYQGTLVAEVDLKSMWDLVDQLQVGKTGYAYVVDNTGNLIAFGDTSRVLRGENEQKILVVNKFIQNLAAATTVMPGITTYSGLLGKTVVGTYVPLVTPDWAIITEMPWQEAYQATIEASAETIGVILILTILAGLVGVYIARRVAVPLVKLTDTATRIAGGEMELHAPFSGPQEVVSLATAFNNMTDQLRD